MGGERDEASSYLHLFQLFLISSCAKVFCITQCFNIMQISIICMLCKCCLYLYLVQGNFHKAYFNKIFSKLRLCILQWIWTGNVEHLLLWFTQGVQPFSPDHKLPPGHSLRWFPYAQCQMNAHCGSTKHQNTQWDTFPFPLFPIYKA